jgi:GDPmannose 4,6-dehydratase
MGMRLRAVVTGVTGQDGFYLTELLKAKGYKVFGIRRRSCQETDLPDCDLIEGDITDAGFVRDVVADTKPHEFYHLAAMSHVGESFKIPATTLETNAIGTLNCLEAVNKTGGRFYQASTSELFGDSPPPQDEETPMRPRSPYAISKLAGYWLTRNYRERGLYAVNGILFNHESPRRGRDFVTQKVCRAAAKGEKVKLGNLESRRDWGHAEDYVFGMWLMLQQDKPDDYVLATGESRTVRELCEIAYGMVGLDWKEYVEVDPSLFRPTEVEHLRGNPSKAQSIGWRRKHSFHSMIGEMVGRQR